VITDAKDYAVSILTAEGDLLTGAGGLAGHKVGATNAVRTIRRHYGDDIHPGDVFAISDPYSGGGMHQNDVYVQQVVVVDGEPVGWIAVSAHMMDVGGMTVGSFAPAATDCYQEGMRLPAVRLVNRDADVREIWDIIATNVRFPAVVEMDLRGMIGATTKAGRRLAEVARTSGVDQFRDTTVALIEATEAALRARIRQVADGEYRCVGWIEWDRRTLRLPVTLVVDGDELEFDLTGAPAQVPHFFNSQPHIVKAAFIAAIAYDFAADLPMSEGLLRPVSLRTTPGSVVEAVAPAPIGAGHVAAAYAASDAMHQCLRLAILATPDHPLTELASTGASGASGTVPINWTARLADGSAETFGIAAGLWTGGSGGPDRDGIDLAPHGSSVGRESLAGFMSQDVELLEQRYPIEIGWRSVDRRDGAGGIGRQRSGDGMSTAFTPYGTEPVYGQVLNARQRLPLDGLAGGLPGRPSRIGLVGRDGTYQPVDVGSAEVVVEVGERLELCAGSTGGIGDPLDRDPEAVLRDVREERLTAEQAAELHGVVRTPTGDLDAAATTARRSELRRARLAGAAAPRRIPDGDVAGTDDAGTFPLYPGVAHRGGVAFATASNTPLAVAPHPWTDGCAVRREPYAEGVTLTWYLDPATGTALFVEAVPDDEDGPTVAVRPRHWLESTPPTPAADHPRP
jgi:N-methylhydantoinase B